MENKIEQLKKTIAANVSGKLHIIELGKVLSLIDLIFKDEIRQMAETSSGD